jgi:RsiW-degrading membrane proteinase PrsW (M82 family)
MPEENILKVVFAFILSVVPAAVWGYIFYKKQVGQKSMAMRTFIAGAVFVAPLLAYKYLWQFFPWLNAFAYTHQLKDDFVGFANLTAVPLDVLVTFLIVGVIEEVTKFMAVRMSGHEKIASIDDAIEMFITAALGFAFVENIIYFYNIMSARGPENILYPFVFRGLFSTFAHIMFSGMLGYYYGLAHFAGPLLKDESNKNRWPVFRKIAKILPFKNEEEFKQEKILQGLVIAIGLHALFNIFLEMNWTFLLVPFLTGGYIWLNYLMEKKEDHKIYGRVVAMSNEPEA